MKLLKIQTESDEQSFPINKISLILAVFFAGIAGYAYFAFLPLFLDSKGFSAGEITFIMTWMGVGMAVFSWIFGRVSDKTGHRKLFFLLGLISQVIVLSLLNVNNDLIFYCILNFFRGIILGMRMPASNALFADIVEKSNEKKEMDIISGKLEISGTQLSFLSTTKSTGWATGVLLSSLTITVFGVDSLVFFLVAMTSISLIFAIPIKDVKKNDNIIIENLVIEEENIQKDIKWENNNIKKKSKVKPLLFISVFFRQFGLIAFLQILSIILKDAGISVGVTGIIIALNPIFQIIAMIVGGRIVDYPRISERLMIAVGFVLSSLTLLCYAFGSFTGSILVFILGQVCLGFAWGCIFTGGNKYIVNRAPMDRAFYTGIWMTNLQVAKIISYQVFAFLWLIFSPTMVLPYAALIPLIGLSLVFWL
ncbi:MAG: MFS transporter [Promethearchaeota archaeon]